MRFTPTEIEGVVVVDLDRIEDDRGFFARSWCREEFRAQGLEFEVVQENVGFSPRAGTLRGMHFQLEPYGEAKVVRCTRGAAFDVAVDLRSAETGYRWFGVELSWENGRMLHVPKGCAHGYLTLQDDTELVYLTSHAYVASAARGIRYDDPAVGVTWPTPVGLVSEKDRSWPLLSESNASGEGGTS